MEFKAINKATALTTAEKETISRSLIDAGIDPGLVKDMLADIDNSCTSGGPCWHDPSKCTKNMVTAQNKLDILKKQISEKKIDVTKLDPAVSKLLK